MESFIRNFAVTSVIVGMCMFGASIPEPLIGVVVLGITVLLSNIALNLYIIKIKADKEAIGCTRDIKRDE